jgi:hypothetical protein
MYNSWEGSGVDVAKTTVMRILLPVNLVDNSHQHSPFLKHTIYGFYEKIFVACY